MNKLLHSAATALALTAGVGLAGLGVATAANAQPAPVPAYHWCPGDFYDPGWGPNWDGNECHDDFHRDRDGFDHSRDFRGGGEFNDRGPGGFDDRWRGPGPEDRGPGFDDHGRGR